MNSTPAPPAESAVPAPGEASPRLSPPGKTPSTQGVPENAVLATFVVVEEGSPSSVDAASTDELLPSGTLETPSAQETPTTEMTGLALPSDDSTPSPGDMPPVWETVIAPATIDLHAGLEHDSTPSTGTLSPDSLLVAQTVPGAVVINEVAWAGTLADVTAQWIELYNTTPEPIWLNGWQLRTADGRLVIELTGVIAAQGYFLLECNNNFTIRDILADSIYVGTLSPDGETLHLLDAAGTVIDTANGDGGPWPAGERATRRSMERIAPDVPDLDANWVTHNGRVRNGVDALGNPIQGTPRQPNAATYPPPRAEPGAVVINEVAWSGTPADPRAEWLELYNTTAQPIDLSGWRLTSGDEGMGVWLQGSIAPHAFFLLERDSDQSVADIPADQVADFGDGLDDGGETLQLLIGSTVIDTVNRDGG
ncbi:MAG: lamin tail domain-containing protein, partial [Anaerolineae bacterium]|nr:lamin tail domain-containing protein [Anaerolineae bacterium]